MNILVISPNFHPRENPRSYRWTSLTYDWAQKGHQIDVVTVQGADLDPDRPLTSNVNIYSVGRRIPIQGDEISNNRIRSWGKWFFRTWMWPDESMFWINPALKKCKELLKQKSYDKVITVSLPFSSHVIGLKLRREFDFNWVVDIGDPFNHHDHFPRNNLFFYRQKNLSTENRIFQQANTIVVTNPGLRKLYLSLYVNLENKIKVAPPVASPIPTNFTKPRNTILTLGYFGSFFCKTREPDILIQFLNQLHRAKIEFRLNLYGRILKTHLSRLISQHGARINYLGLVSRSEVISKMCAMDFLINIGNATEHQLPSKAVDYLISGRPIINLVQNEDDQSKYFFQDLDSILHWNEESDISSVKNFMERDFGEKDPKSQTLIKTYTSKEAFEEIYLSP